MHLRGALALVAAALVVLVPSSARAWQESHQLGDDVEVRVDPDGKAAIRHSLRWHVVRGPLKSIDLANLDPMGEIDPEVAVAAEDGRALGAHASRVTERDGSVVRITVDEPRALLRGNFSFALNVRADLVASHAITRDGATWRMGWSAPVAVDGFDGARTLFVLPAAPDPPRPIVADTGAVDDSVVTALHRGVTQDSLELVRPHVARGEAVSWTLRLDPRALPKVVDPRLRTQPIARLAAEPDRLHAAGLLVGLFAVALLYGWAALRRGPGTRGGWVAARGALAGLAAAAGIGLEVEAEPTAGAVCVAIAVLAASMRGPDGKPGPRGPGRWLVVRPEEAFAGPPDRRRSLALAAMGLAVIGAIVARMPAELAWQVALDASLLVPLLLPRGGEPPGPVCLRASAQWLERVCRKLLPASGAPLRVLPWARVPVDSSRIEELRLLVLPRLSMPGVLGLEVGLAWASTPLGLAASPEVLARVLDGSPAALRLSNELPRARALPGRRPEERVVRMLPRVPTHAGTAGLVRELAQTLTDRRVSLPSPTRAGWVVEERRAKRGPPQRAGEDEAHETGRVAAGGEVAA